MHEMDAVARREDPAKPTSGLDAKRVADMSRVSAKALDDLWQRAMKSSPRAEGLRDNNATNQRIVKEIRARRNPISFADTNVWTIYPCELRGLSVAARTDASSSITEITESIDKT